MNKEILLTKEGYDKLQDELEILKTVKRPEIASQLKDAVGFGDLAENAEYELARLAQSELESKINILEGKLSRARVVKVEEIDKNIVSIGVKVKVKDELGETVTYSIVGEGEGDIESGKLSVQSPVGAGLLGQIKGSVINIKIPNGIAKYKILDITI